MQSSQIHQVALTTSLTPKMIRVGHGNATFTEFSSMTNLGITNVNSTITSADTTISTTTG